MGALYRSRRQCEFELKLNFPYRNIANDFAPDRPFLPPQRNRLIIPPSGGIRNTFQPGNVRRPQRFNRRGPDRRLPRPINRQGLHERPGPPYPGPNPRAPHLPLDKTIIHPTNHHPVYNLPPDSQESRPEEEVEVVYVEPVKTTTTTTTTTTKAPTVIVLQQNPYPYNMYPHQQPPHYSGYPQYQYHPPPPMTTTTTTTTPTTPSTTSMTTTKKPKKKRKKKKRKKGQITYQNMAPDVLIDGILPPEPPNRPPGPALATRLKNKLITKRIGHSQSSVINHIVPPPMQTRRFRGNWQRSSRRRFRPQAIQRDPYLIQHSNVNYNRRIHQNNGIQGAFDDEFQNTFKHSQYPQPPRVPQAPPNIFSQGHPGGQSDSLPYNPTLPEHTIYVHPPTTTKPPIKRPPPQHPGVRVPGVEVPPHSGSIQDIIEAVDPNRYRRVELTNPNPTSYAGYRPPIGWKPEEDKEYNPQTNTYDYQRPANYYEAPVKVPNLTPPIGNV